MPVLRWQLHACICIPHLHTLDEPAPECVYSCYTPEPALLPRYTPEPLASARVRV
jgi:hypothetical protein